MPIRYDSLTQKHLLHKAPTLTFSRLCKHLESAFKNSGKENKTEGESNEQIQKEKGMNKINEDVTRRGEEKRESSALKV